MKSPGLSTMSEMKLTVAFFKWREAKMRRIIEELKAQPAVMVSEYAKALFGFDYFQIGPAY